MILPDAKIQALCASNFRTLIAPFNQAQLQPASYDFRLGNEFLTFTGLSCDVIDPRDPSTFDMELSRLGEGEYFDLLPGGFALASSIETFCLPRMVVGQLGGKSSLGRLGLQVHSTAGFFDPGFNGQATLELSNLAHRPIRLNPGMLIAQMEFFRLESEPRRVYGDKGLRNKYAGQNGPTASLYHQNS
jgi:dCTP deaminase